MRRISDGVNLTLYRWLDYFVNRGGPVGNSLILPVVQPVGDTR